jgi:PEP-CTERM motif
MRHLVIASLMVGLMSALAGSASATYIYANDDTFTYEGAKDTPQDQNSSGILMKSQSGARRYGWIEFTLGPTPVTSASLNLYQAGDWGYNYQVLVRAKEFDFDENIFTWNNGPTDGGTWPQVGTWNAVTGARQYYGIDLTTFYNDNLGKTISFRLGVNTSGSNYGGGYEDRENTRGTGNVPYIEWVPEPSAMLLLAAGLGLAVSRRRR